MPIGMVIVSYVVCMLFPEGKRAAVYLNLLGGMVLHLLIDVLQDHYGVGYPLLFPFWGKPFELGWIGSEATVTVAPVLGLCAVVVWWSRWRKHLRQLRSEEGVAPIG